MGSTIAMLLTCGVFWMAGPEGADKKQPLSMGQTLPGQPEPPAQGGSEPLSDAERISRMQRALDTNKKELKDLQKMLENPESEYHQSEAEFKKLDAQLTALKAKEKKLRQENPNADLAPIQAELKTLEANWEKSRDRFNLLIQERRVLQEKVAALQQMITQNQEALAKMTGPVPPPVQPGTNPPNGTVPPPTPPQPPTVGTGNPTTTPPVPGTTPPNGQANTQQPGTDPANPGTLIPGKTKAQSKELIAAKNDVLAKEAAALDAKGKAASVEARLAALRKTIALQQKLLESARAKADQSHTTELALIKELEQKRNENPETLKPLWAKLAEAQEQYATARMGAREISQQLNVQMAELNDLQAEEIAAAQELAEKQKDAESAQKKVTDLENPFTVKNLWHWIVDRGPKLVLIALGIYLLHSLVGLFTRRIVNIVALSSTRGTEEDRENRAQTLVGVFRNAAYFVILGGGVVMLLDVAGIPVIPLMGGAAVLGLAVAFGAQNLIRDYFSGFMVLMEDQYGINDVVRIGSTAGLVEKITLRMTVLRDLEGIVHFIPHGTITTVSNMTHGWSRALFDIGVAYKEDVDRVMRILVDIGQEMRRDAKFGSLILADPEMLGVDSFGDSAVVIKFYIKTRPLQQWAVKRETLRRIKKRFDELGIEIPFPHRTVFHRHEEVPALEHGQIHTPDSERGAA